MVYPGCKEDRKGNTPLWSYPPLWAKSPHGPLVYSCWQGARLIMCSLRQPRREWVSGSGREAEGWLPRPAGSPGPNTALMRATGTDGHTQGARDYCAGPRGAGERDPRRGGEESPIGSPAADLCPCSHSASMYCCFLLMMVHVWNICINPPVGTCVPHVLYTLHVCMMLVYPIPLKILSSEARSIKQLS